MATADDYGISAKLVITVTGEKESQNFTLSVSKTTVGIREKILPLLSVEGIKEDAAITYYLMNGDSPAPESDTVIDENFAFAQTGTGSICRGNRQLCGNGLCAGCHHRHAAR